MKLSDTTRRRVRDVIVPHEVAVAEIARRQQVSGRRAVELGLAVREMLLLLPPEERTKT